MTLKSRVIIVVNKYWECDPVCWVLTNKYINDNGQCNIDLGEPNSLKIVTYPSYGPVKPESAEDTIPRMVFETDQRVIEVWCISDLLSHSGEAYPPNSDAYNRTQSSSQEKMKLLPIIFKYDKAAVVDLVVAVGTASSGPDVNQGFNFGSDNINGSVIIGSKVFLYDGENNDSDPNNAMPPPQTKLPYPFSQYGHGRSGCWNTIFTSSSESLIDQLSKDKLPHLEKLLLCPPLNPGLVNQNIFINKEYTAIGDVNITDYKCYKDSDAKAGEAWCSYKDKNSIGASVETTHGLIYQAAKNHLNTSTPPFIFVSGVVDRFNKFDIDVKDQPYAQNVTGAHNAGVAIAYIVSQIIG